MGLVIELIKGAQLSLRVDQKRTSHLEAAETDRSNLHERITDRSGDSVVIDLSGIAHVDAQLVKELMQLSRQLDGKSRNVVIRNPEVEVTRTLLLSGFFGMTRSLEFEHTGSL